MYNLSSSAPERTVRPEIATAACSGRSARAELVFIRGGGRTILGRQYVPYPFHVTRPFFLDGAQPDIATLYMQSASGGIFRADDLSLRIESRPGARAHLTTQAATVVHDTGRFPARQTSEIVVRDNSFLAYTPDPLILFPGASLVNDVRIEVSDGAKAIISDAIARHDPQGLDRPFGNFVQRLAIIGKDGKVLATDHAELSGEDFASAASPLGSFRAFGSVFLLGATMEALADLQTLFCDSERLVGLGELPNNAGCVARCLASDSAELRLMLDMIFERAFTEMTGARPATRRK
ncbi:MAG: urease accessory protein UreD [Methylovirgula sp.]